MNEDDEYETPCTCISHQARRARVRAVALENETYVSLVDLLEWMQLSGQSCIEGLKRSAAEDEMPPEMLTAVSVATMNAEQGMQMLHAITGSLYDEEIGSLTDDTVLIRPEEMSLNTNTIPSDWAPSGSEGEHDHGSGAR